MSDPIAWLVGGGSALAIIAMVWGKFKALSTRLFSLAIVTVRCDFQAAGPVYRYFNDKFKQSKTGPVTYMAHKMFVYSRRKTETIAGQTLDEQATVFWKSWLPVFVRQISGRQNATEQTSQSGGLAITFLRGTFNTDQLIRDAVGHVNALVHDTSRSRFSVIDITGSPKTATFGLGSRNSGEPNKEPGVIDLDRFRLVTHTRDELERPPERNVESSAFQFDGDCLSVIDECKRWYQLEDWYKTRSIPWRRGFALVGVPGSGKTRLVVEVGLQLGIPIYRFDLFSCDNREFRNGWDKASSNSPCIALFDDIDVYFNGRESTVKDEDGFRQDSLTFDTFLNTISGAKENDGVLVFITTNHPDHLDRALIDRPGRIDRVVKIDAMPEKAKRKTIEVILKDWPEEIPSMIVKTQDQTAAVIVNECTKVALNRLWESHTIK
jgi:ATPase family protein associated with various cellular activities (AAA)